MITNTKNVRTFKQFQDALAAAVRWTHPDYTNNGITRERARRVAEARKRSRRWPPQRPSAKAGIRAWR